MALAAEQPLTAAEQLAGSNFWSSKITAIFGWHNLWTAPCLEQYIDVEKKEKNISLHIQYIYLICSSLILWWKIIVNLVIPKPNIIEYFLLLRNFYKH